MCVEEGFYGLMNRFVKTVVDGRGLHVERRAVSSRKHERQLLREAAGSVVLTCAACLRGWLMSGPFYDCYSFSVCFGAGYSMRVARDGAVRCRSRTFDPSKPIQLQRSRAQKGGAARPDTGVSIIAS